MKKISKVYLGINILSIIIILYHSVIYQTHGYTALLKVSTSAMFVMLGLINLSYAFISKQKNIKFYMFMSLGLAFACLGDYLILSNFVFGAGSFALGHVLFVIAYCFVSKIKKLDLLFSICLYIGCLIFLLGCPLLNFDDNVFKIVCIIYALIISLMVGKALGNYINNKNYATLTIVLSSVVFFFSDLMLVLGWFVKDIEWADNVCLGTYFPALTFLAFSMLLMSFVNDKKEVKLCK